MDSGVGVLPISVAFNVVHATPTPMARLVAAIPPAALVLSFELLMRQLRATLRRDCRTRPGDRAPAGRHPRPRDTRARALPRVGGVGKPAARTSPRNLHRAPTRRLTRHRHRPRARARPLRRLHPPATTPARHWWRSHRLTSGRWRRGARVALLAMAGDQPRAATTPMQVRTNGSNPRSRWGGSNGQAGEHVDGSDGDRRLITSTSPISTRFRSWQVPSRNRNSC